MLKRVAITVLSSLILFPASAYCAIENELSAIDTQRDEVLKQLTGELISGKISIEDAQKLKGELDDVVKLETKAKEEPLTSAERITEINSALQQVRSHIAATTHATKVWLGIDSQDRTLDKKITDALEARKITKDQASDLKQASDGLRARESNGDPTHSMEYTDALSLAQDIQTLNSKIDQAIAGK